MSKSSKKLSLPPLPGRLKGASVTKERTTRRDWENYIHSVNKRFRKVEMKHSENGFLNKMYYRIIDTARRYNKPVRYFTYASATKCALQVVEEDN